jgi:hypothetical protein
MKIEFAPEGLLLERENAISLPWKNEKSVKA